MTPVKSSNIKAIGYDVEKLILNVEFKNGKTLGYKYVSSPEYEALVNDESVEKHFNQFVKPDKVAFEIVEGDNGDTLHVNESEASRDGWISVEDKEPEKKGNVLVYDGNYHVALFNPGHKNYRYDCDSYDVEPTHWMPLPEPPK